MSNALTNIACAISEVELEQDYLAKKMQLTTVEQIDEAFDAFRLKDALGKTWFTLSNIVLDLEQEINEQSVWCDTETRLAAINKKGF